MKMSKMGRSKYLEKGARREQRETTRVFSQIKAVVFWNFKMEETKIVFLLEVNFVIVIFKK